MSRYVVANWKSHKTLAEAEKWLEIFLRHYRPDPQVQVIIAPSFIFLVPLAQLLQRYEIDSLSLAAQDLSPFPKGAYTGAVAAEMVSDLIDYALVGHAERRRYFHETDQEIANKISEAVAAGIKPILCIDQPYVRSQFAALNETDMHELIIGYGPVMAIGIDIPPPPEKIGQVISEIRTIVPDRPILYGGSVNATNAGNYLRLEGVAGLMVGTASLEPEEFVDICNAASFL